MAHAHKCHQLLTYTDNIRILDGFEMQNILTASQAQDLREAYEVMRALEHRLTLQNQVGEVSSHDLREQRQKVTAIWTTMMES